MKAPYTLYPNDEHIKPDTRPKTWSKQYRFPLHFAQEKQYFKLPELDLFSQQSHYKPFFIDLIETEIKEPTYIPFDVVKT